jgi:two-component system NtrC family sensor kinase
VRGNVLSRQLRRLGLTPDRPPDAPAWRQFLDKVAATYDGHDQDRYLLERAMTLSGEEMRDLHDALRRDRERLRAVIDCLDVGLIVLDADLRAELANPEAARVFGVTAEQIRRWTLSDLLRCGRDDPQVLDLLESLLAVDGAPAIRGQLHDVRVRTVDGAMVPVALSVVPVQHQGTGMGAVVVLRDLSELRRLEVELRQAQKLEAVGRLAAGIAHELNTPIQFIGDNIRFISSCLSDLLTAVELACTAHTVEPERVMTGRGGRPPDAGNPDLSYLIEELPEALAQSLEGVERVTSIVRAMKSFAHPGKATPATADLNQALRDTVTVARNEIKNIAEVVLELGDLPAVECLVHDLKQVFLNLVVNAAHAIADRQRVREGMGRIVLRTRADGDHVLISVSDDGCGIPDDIAEHVFEPFFTTKEVGRGTGQGLALARSVIVDGHRGTIGLQSQPMAGATFTIRIPVRSQEGR